MVNVYKQFEKELQEALDRQEDRYASILADLKKRLDLLKAKLIGHIREIRLLNILIKKY